MDGDESERNSLRSVKALSWRSSSGHHQSPSRNSLKDMDGDQAVANPVRRTGASCRTRRGDTTTDLSAFMNNQFFFRENNPPVVNNRFNNEEATRHGRMLEWLRDVEEMQMSASDSYLDSSTNRCLSSCDVVAAAAAAAAPRPPRLSSSGPLNTRSSAAKAPPRSDQFTTLHRHSPSAVCKLPCQSCGSSAHENMPQQDRYSPSTQSYGETLSGPVGLYKRNDRLSKSARHPEMAMDVPIEAKKEPSPVAQLPVAMYPRFDRFSKSARHPEMAANVVLAGGSNGDSNKGFLTSSKRNAADVGRNVRHMRSASLSMVTTDGRFRRDEEKRDLLPIESNRNSRENMPRFLHSASTREQRGTVKSKHASNTGFPSAATKETETKSPAAAVQQWFSQLLRKGPKSGPKVVPIKAGKPPRQPKNKDWTVTRKPSKNHGDRIAGVSYNSSSVKPEPEEIMVGATLGDVLDTKGVIFTETKVLLKASAKDDRRSSVNNENMHGTFPTMDLRRSTSVQSGLLFHNNPVQEKASEPISGTQNLDSNRSKQLPKAKGGLLSPPKRRKEAASRLEMLVKDNERYNVNSSSSANSSPQSSRHQQWDLDSIAEKQGELKPKQYEVEELNEFLWNQRKSINQRNLSNLQVMVILSGESHSSLSSMVSTICYAWIMENATHRKPNGWIYIPIINIPRRSMWRNEQAAWLFHNSGLDAKALLFSDEVDMEKLAHTKKNKMVVIGHDVLKPNGEVASCCTMLVEKHSQDVQSMLKGAILKKLLLAGLLLDTENLDFSSVFCTARDEAAVALLSCGAGPNGRYGFYLQLKRQYYDRSFRNILREMYGEIGDRFVSETAMLEEEESKQHHGEETSQKQVILISDKVINVTKEIRPGMTSASSSITDSSGPLTTINVDSSPSSRPNSTSSNNSDTMALQQVVFSPGPGGKFVEATTDATAGGWKAMNRNGVSRFFNGFGRSRNAFSALRVLTRSDQH